MSAEDIIRRISQSFLPTTKPGTFAPYVRKTLYIKTHPDNDDRVEWVIAPDEQVILHPALTKAQTKAWYESAAYELDWYMQRAMGLHRAADELPWWKFWTKWRARREARAMFAFCQIRWEELAEQAYRDSVLAYLTPGQEDSPLRRLVKMALVRVGVTCDDPEEKP